MDGIVDNQNIWIPIVGTIINNSFSINGDILHWLLVRGERSDLSTFASVSNKKDILSQNHDIVMGVKFYSWYGIPHAVILE